MDRYKACEKVLKEKIGVECRDNYMRLREDFRDISASTKSSVNPIPNVKDLKKSDLTNENLAETLSSCLHTAVEVAWKNNDSKTDESQKEHTIAHEKNLSHFIQTIKHGNPTISDKTISLCHLKRSTGSLVYDAGSFDIFTDGYYEHGNVIYRNGCCSEVAYGSRGSYSDLLYNYCKNVRGALKNELNLSIIKDIQREDVDMASVSVSSTEVPKNLRIQHLYGLPHVEVIKSDTFDLYYNYNNKTSNNIGSQPKRNKSNYRIETVSKSLREVYRTHTNDNTNKNKPPKQLLARGIDNNNQSKELILINESSFENIHDIPREYIVVADKKGIKVYNCNTYSATIQPSIEERQKDICKSIYINEVLGEKLKNRLLLKLLRYEFARFESPKTWRKNIDTINKCISSIKWSCLWQNWNFFNGSNATELCYQEMLRSFDIDNDDQVTDLPSLCNDFFNYLSVNNQVTSANLVSFITQLVTRYSTDVLLEFSKHFDVLRTKLYAELSENSVELGKISDGSSAEVEDILIDVPEQSQTHGKAKSLENLEEMRSKYLPVHTVNAKDPSELTDLYKIIDYDLLNDENFTLEPYHRCLSSPESCNLLRSSKLTKTVVDLCKSHASNRKTFTYTKEEVARSLKILDILILLLQSSNKQYTNPADLHKFTSTIHKVPMELSVWILGQFYTRNSESNFYIQSDGCKKLMCFVIWICIYLSPSNQWVFDFSVLLNIDFKSMFTLHILFDNCTQITSIVPKSYKKTIFKLQVPLIPATTNNSQFNNLVTAINSKRLKRR